MNRKSQRRAGTIMNGRILLLLLAAAVAVPARAADGASAGMRFRLLERTPFEETFLPGAPSELQFRTSVGLSTEGGTDEWHDRLVLAIPVFTGLYCGGADPADALPTFLLSESGWAEFVCSGDAPVFRRNPAELTKVVLSRHGVYLQMIGIGAANFRSVNDDGTFGEPADAPPERDCRRYVFDLTVCFEPMPAVVGERLTLFEPERRTRRLAIVEVRRP